MSEAIYNYNTLAEFVIKLNKFYTIINYNNEYFRMFSYMGGKDIIKWNWFDRNIKGPFYTLLSHFLTKYFSYYTQNGKKYIWNKEDKKLEKEFYQGKIEFWNLINKTIKDATIRN